jgi:hypothetical protein
MKIAILSPPGAAVAFNGAAGLMKTLTREPINHLPDFAKCLRAGIHKAGPDCPCGIQETHEHCLGCGKIVSIGSGEVIREYQLRLPKRGFV